MADDVDDTPPTPFDLEDRRLAHRAGAAQVQTQAGLAGESPVVQALLEAADTLLVVLNSNRQIVAANCKFSGPRAMSTLLGQRPGEVLECIHARECAGGCGTAEACRECGALQTMQRSLKSGRTSEGECLLTVAHEQSTRSLEFNVRATPVRVRDEQFLVFSLRDISAEKRRTVLEQVFFHDVLNTLSGLLGWSRALERASPERAAEIAGRIAHLAHELERAVRDQRTLTLAENGTLEPLRVEVRPEEVLASVEVLFSHHAALRDRHLAIEPPPPGLSLRTDAALLVRILANMVTNALEATEPGGRVRVYTSASAGHERPAFRFHVHNAAVIPARVKHHIFQRSYSTKASTGRGLGTYSMKLFGERYLRGQVSFSSDEGLGTVFTLSLPA